MNNLIMNYFKNKLKLLAVSALTLTALGFAFAHPVAAQESSEDPLAGATIIDQTEESLDGATVMEEGSKEESFSGATTSEEYGVSEAENTSEWQITTAENPNGYDEYTVSNADGTFSYTYSVDEKYGNFTVKQTRSSFSSVTLVSLSGRKMQCSVGDYIMCGSSR